MKRYISIISAILILFSFAGCSKADASEGTPTPEAPSVTDNGLIVNPTPTPSPVPTPMPYSNPLNGEPMEEDPGNMRPYAVMFNNIIYAMPQCGVSQADIIYEILAEGGVTRMEGIYSDISKTKTLGSMRSIRPYYIEVALSFDAIVIHAGGSEQAYKDIANKNVDNIDGVRGAYGSQIFYRDPNRQQYGIEHSLFTTPEKILEYLPKLEYRLEHEGEFDYGLSFTEDAVPKNGASAATIDVDFGGQKMTYLTFDGSLGKYTAVQHDQDYIDGDTGEKVAFDNVLILYADTQVLDNYGRRSVDLEGTGEGQFACGGKYIDITWSHNGTGSSFTYALTNGDELELNIGKTYIAIVPTGSEIIYG